MPDQPPVFGDQLRHFRLRAGLTQEELAERSGLAAATISALERGVRRRPYHHTRRQLAEALNLSPTELAAFLARSVTVEVLDNAALIAAHPAPGNLPSPREPLIGRTREVEAVCRLILRDRKRLVTLTGIGGCGKTRLALQVSNELRPAFPGGVWLVELAPVADPQLLPQAVATSLGLKDIDGAPLMDLLGNRLSGSPLLLVVDNCEHLSEPCASLIERLLSTCPNLSVLATSREPLQIAGEHQWRVPPLVAPEPQGDYSLMSVAGFAAVQLFVSRAQAVVPTFRLTDENAAAVAQICARLAGLPLPVELAAARVRVLTVEQILTRLDDALRLLSGGSRALPIRQRTLRAALDWSYDLLEAREQTGFERLAVFAGGCDLEAAEAICTGDGGSAEDVLELLASLVDKSLVQVGARSTAARYFLLEPVRQYALQRLEARDALQDTRGRHAAHYLALAERAAPNLRGPAQMEWLDRLESERDNLRAALQHAHTSENPEVGLRLAVALAPFWEGRGYLSEGRHWIETLLNLPAANAVPARLRAQALLAGGRLAQWQTHLDSATELLERSIALACPLDDRALIAEARVYLGAVTRRQGAFERSVRELETSLELYRALDDVPGIALALLTLGVTVRFQGDAARSSDLLEESLDLFQRCGDLRWIAITQTMLGESRLYQGDLIRASCYIREGLAGHQATGDRTFSIFGLLSLAALMAAQAEPVQSARLLGAMEALTETVGAPLAPANRKNYRRIVEAVRGHLSAADFERALAAGRTLTLEQAIHEALTSEPAAPPPPNATSSRLLTEREEDVVRLLIQGRTDRQIADALAISTRTVGVHVRHVIAKLGVHSRWQVAEWAKAQELGEPAANGANHDVVLTQRT